MNGEECVRDVLAGPDRDDLRRTAVAEILGVVKDP